MLGFAPKDASNSEMTRCSRQAKERAKAVLELDTDLELLEKYTDLFEEFRALSNWSVVHWAVSSEAKKRKLSGAEMKDGCIVMSVLYSEDNPSAKLDAKIIEEAKRYQVALRQQESKGQNQDTVALESISEEVPALEGVVDRCKSTQRLWQRSSSELKKDGFKDAIKTAVVGLNDVHGEVILSGRGKEAARNLVSQLTFLERLAYQHGSVEEAQAQLSKTIMEQRKLLKKINEDSSSLNGNLPPQLAEQIQNICPLETAIEEIRENWPSIRSFIEKVWPKDKGRATTAIEGILFVSA